MPPLNGDSKALWRSEAERTGAPEFNAHLHREFPEGASELTSEGRRNFLKIMGASAAIAGAAGCNLVRRPVQHIHPYANAPEAVIPGRPLFYATAMQLAESVVGLLVESHEGRPTKIEGNPGHSQSLGAAGVFNQASVLGLYDPDRLKSATIGGKTASVDEVSAWMAEARKKTLTIGGGGLAILTETQLSPTFYRLLKEFRKTFPKAMVVKYEPVNLDTLHHGLFAATGAWITPVYHFEKADRIISFDNDFLGHGPGHLVNSRHFASRRDPSHPAGMNRLYTIESGFSMTGAKADHRIALHPSLVEKALYQLANALLASGRLDSKTIPQELATRLEKASQYNVLDAAHLAAMAGDLTEKRGRSLILVGHKQSAAAHGLAYLLNAALGAHGETVTYVQRPFANDALQTTSSLDGLNELADKMDKGEVETLMILGGDPVYTAPADLNIEEKFSKVANALHLTLSENATSRACKASVPLSHYLESWGDLQALDGSVSIVQPLISPLYESRSALSLLAGLLGLTADDYALVKETNGAVPWRRSLHEGVVEGPQKAVTAPAFSNRGFFEALDKSMAIPASGEEMAVIFETDPKLFDGRFANNGWLQELPDPVNKLTWDNAALMSPKTARAMGVKNEDVVQITFDGRSIEAAVWTVPGHAHQATTLNLGYGQKNPGRVGIGTGFNASALRTATAFHVGANAAIKPLSRRYKLATTQEHWSMEGRPQYRQSTLEEFKKNPGFAEEMVHAPHDKSLWKEKTYDTGYQWGMSVDLAKCTGCNACVTACQSENNIPIVGKEEVLVGREMHWIRVDRYFEGKEDDPNLVEQPVLCLQCEMAPCEQVCPVAATSHSEEGLNDMTYNRCIGTRYCSNNCPAKVRRFNFYDFHQRNPQAKPKDDRQHLFELFKEPEKTVQMQFNPDVTVRMRGVMEKCTYCIQRINQAKIGAEVAGKPLGDGDVKTACQQTCPAGALTFGNIRDASSKVSETKRDPRNYQLLADLKLSPRTTYLASVRNPHPTLVKQS